MSSTDLSRAALLASLAVILTCAGPLAAAGDLPEIQLKGVPFHWTPLPEILAPLGSGPDSVTMSVGGNAVFEGTIESLASGGATLKFDHTGHGELDISANGKTVPVRFRLIHRGCRKRRPNRCFLRRSPRYCPARSSAITVPRYRIPR